MHTMKSNMINILKNGLKQRKVRNTLIGLYVLLIIGLSASARATEMRIFPQPPQASAANQLQSFVGEMIVSVDGQTYLMTEDATYELRSNHDLTAYNGQSVEVIGFEIKHKVGPVYEFQMANPLQAVEERMPVAPVVIVYNVSILQ